MIGEFSAWRGQQAVLELRGQYVLMRELLDSMTSVLEKIGVQLPLAQDLDLGLDRLALAVSRIEGYFEKPAAEWSMPEVERLADEHGRILADLRSLMARAVAAMRPAPLH